MRHLVAHLHINDTNEYVEVVELILRSHAFRVCLSEREQRDMPLARARTAIANLRPDVLGLFIAHGALSCGSLVNSCGLFGDKACVDVLMASGVSLLHHNEAMGRAVRARNVEVLVAFLENGMDVEANSEEDDALKIAAEEGDAVVLKLLISSGFADVNKRFTNNMTPVLLVAASENQEDLLSVLSALLKAGADLYAQNDQGDSLLHLLCRFHRGPAAIHLVLKHGADPNALNQDNATPLMILLEDTGGGWSTAALDALFEYGASLALCESSWVMQNADTRAFLESRHAIYSWET